MADQNDKKAGKLDRPYAGRRRMPEGWGTDDKDMPVLCRQIRFFREKKGIEQKELAAKIGIKSNAVSNWENGRARPDIALLPKIAEVLEVTIDDLFDVKKPETQKAPEEQKPAITMTKTTTSEEDILLEGFQQLSSGHRSVVSSMVQQLCDVEDRELYDSISEETMFTKGLCAGFDPGAEYEDQGETIHLYKSKLHPLMDCVFPVNGDSMEPDFHSGDLVMVQRLSERSGLLYGEIGAFSFHNETYIKKYTKKGLVSLNKKYKLMQFNADDDVYLIGRVLGVLDPDAVVSYEDMVRYERVKKRIESK